MSNADITAEEEGDRQTKELTDLFRQENPNAEEYDRSKFAATKGKKSSVFRVPKITAHYADVSQPESVNACLAEVLEQHGKIDHLVTSAGFTENYAAEEYPYERMKKLWGVNVDGTYLFAVGVANHLMARKAAGSICNDWKHVLDLLSTCPSRKHRTTQLRRLFDIWLPVWLSSGRMLTFESTVSVQAIC